jgi:hypothetical protein
VGWGGRRAIDKTSSALLPFTLRHLPPSVLDSIWVIAGDQPGSGNLLTTSLVLDW